MELEGTGYVMKAGAAHGITVGAEFSVYREHDLPPRTTPLGTLVACDVSEFSTTMSVPPGTEPFALVGSAFALQTKPGTEENLRLHIAMDTTLVNIFETLAPRIGPSSPGQRRILFVEKTDAELGLELEDGQIVVNILNPLVTKYGLVRMPSSSRIQPDVDQVYPIMRAAAHYHWHLRRQGTSDLQNGIQIEFKAVEFTVDDDLNDIGCPVGPDLNVGGVVTITASDRVMYGVRIVNNTALALYPSLFYFDNSDLSIGTTLNWRERLFTNVH